MSSHVGSEGAQAGIEDPAVPRALQVGLRLAQQVGSSIGLRQPTYLKIVNDHGDGHEQSAMLPLSLVWKLEGHPVTSSLNPLRLSVLISERVLA